MFCSLVSVTSLVLWPKWPGVLVSSESLGPVGYLCWVFSQRARPLGFEMPTLSLLFQVPMWPLGFGVPAWSLGLLAQQQFSVNVVEWNKKLRGRGVVWGLLD